MKIILKSIELENFKGMKSLKVNFQELVTIISGRNESGKTRIADSWNWVLFGKDTNDRKDFEIKCNDKDGNVIHGQESSVEAVLVVDGIETKLKRTYKETWTKKTGEADRVLTGHTTSYMINDVDIESKKEYDKRVEAIISEQMFKLLSTNNYFNVFVDWKKRREIIMDMFANSIPSDIDIAGKNTKLKELSEYLANKEISDIIAETKAKKSKLNKEINEIPVRIDELKKSEKSCEIDVDDVNKQIDSIHVSNLALDNALASTNQGSASVSKINELKMKANDLTRQLKIDKQNIVDALEVDLKKKSNVYQNICSSIDEAQEILQKLMNKNVDNAETKALLYKDFDSIKAEKFDSDTTSCPTCFQKLTQEKIRILFEEFEASKKARLDKIKERGQKINAEIAENEKAIETYTKMLEETKLALEKQLKPVEEAMKEIESEKSKPALKTSPEIEKIIEEVKQLEASLKDPNGEQKTAILKEKAENKLELDRLNKLLIANATISSNKDRIEALQKRERELAQQFADLEKLDFLASEFVKIKVNLIEEKVSEKFGGIKFKLFEILVNGAIKECCETTVEGVIFEALSNGAKIVCGLKIIDVLQKHYNIKLPVFVDNSEGVTKEIALDTQLIKLVATESDLYTH